MGNVKDLTGHDLLKFWIYSDVDNANGFTFEIAETVFSYGTTDRCTGGTPSADSVVTAGYEASKGCDDNAGTSWSSTDTAFPHWWKYDCGAGVSWKISKFTASAYLGVSGYRMKNFTILGSNDDTNWTTIYTGLMANSAGVQTFTFTNTTAYRYFKVNCTDSYDTASGNQISVYEFEMFEGIYPTTITVNTGALTASCWQEISLDLSGVADGDKNAIRYLDFKNLTNGAVSCVFDSIKAFNGEIYIDSPNRTLYKVNKEYVYNHSAKPEKVQYEKIIYPSDDAGVFKKLQIQIMVQIQL